VQTEATTVERIFLKKIRIRDSMGVHTIPENALKVHALPETQHVG
jgi:hypothetical protein